MNFDDFKYRVQYLRTKDWWSFRWRELCEWCNATYGVRKWEYIDESFAFRTDEDRTLFMLKWL